MFTHGVDDDWVLLALLAQEIGGSDLGQAEHLGEVRVLVTCEFSDVSLSNLTQGLLLLEVFALLSLLLGDSGLLFIGAM